MQARARNVRPIANPWPRLALAAALLLWAGANLWSGIFQWQAIMAQEGVNRAVSVLLTIVFSIGPLLVAVLLIRSVAARPEPPSGKHADRKRR
jgi:hypothetical protein